MNRSCGVDVFEVVGRSPQLGYVNRSGTEGSVNF